MIPEGYKRALFLGTTGSGKTSLLCRIIGTQEIKNFPPVSTSKTTTCPTEFILDGGPVYQAEALTISREKARKLIDECIAKALEEAVAGSSDHLILQRLLYHPEQRFRLAYTLGVPASPPAEDDEDDGETDCGEMSALSESQRSGITNFLSRVLSQIKKLARDSTSSSQFLSDDIVKKIEERFRPFKKTGLPQTPDWPANIHLIAGGRDEFISQVRYLIGNDASLFGSLISPLIEKIRLSGPFAPRGESCSQLSVMDSEGLGHISSTATTLPVAITDHFSEFDSIVLVDNSKQPMQAATQAVIKASYLYGHEHKLILANTHFDQIHGANLPDSYAKKRHLTGSAENFLNTHKGKTSGRILLRLKRAMCEDALFFSRLNQEKDSKMTLKNLSKFLAALHRSRTRDFGILPQYIFNDLRKYLNRSSEIFHERWEGYLQTEHWTRVKALTRRFAHNCNAHELEYSNMRPLADLIESVQQEVSPLIESPASWSHQTRSEEEQDAAIRYVKQQLYNALRRFAYDSLYSHELEAWKFTDSLHGQGSASERNKNIGEILEREVHPNGIFVPAIAKVIYGVTGNTFQNSLPL